MYLSKILLTAGAFTILTHSVVADPNLVVGYKPKTGSLSVKNVGSSAADKSVVTISCKGVANWIKEEGYEEYAFPKCPSDFKKMANAKFAKQTGLEITKLASGGSAKKAIKLKKPGLQPGFYEFTVCADAKDNIVESNEKDNCKTVKHFKIAEVALVISDDDK